MIILCVRCDHFQGSLPPMGSADTGSPTIRISPAIRISGNRGSPAIEDLLLGGELAELSLPEIRREREAEICLFFLELLFCPSPAGDRLHSSPLWASTGGISLLWQKQCFLSLSLLGLRASLLQLHIRSSQRTSALLPLAIPTMHDGISLFHRGLITLYLWSCDGLQTI